ncbi:unnamed protein product [Blepharisma stoltei]|uniref:Secreted protein n=1 Tax=Blepharisma stoltei TaxID=1481888 RepID=A0AAU9IP37_9CILI|nr:unnamed protein product [Blepharisma stoltei]
MQCVLGAIILYVAGVWHLKTSANVIILEKSEIIKLVQAVLCRQDQCHGLNWIIAIHAIYIIAQLAKRGCMIAAVESGHLGFKIVPCVEI